MATTAVKERAIPFRDHEVRAILDGRKTQFRRLIRWNREANPGYWPCVTRGVPALIVDANPASNRPLRCPYGEVGDRLWGQETWARRLDVNGDQHPDKGRHYALYRANGDDLHGPHWHPYPSRWAIATTMPRWASRITLEIVERRIQRLQEISEEDALAEGSPLVSGSYGHRTWFRELWNEAHGKRPGCSWVNDPWVWAITFRRVEEGKYDR